jgi:hypothetical protein
LDGEPAFHERFRRVISLHCHDECSANLRAERHLSLAASGQEKFASMQLLCDAHKKAQVIAGLMEVNKPFDTKLIRLSLSLRGTIRHHLRREARRLIKEQLVIYIGGRPSIEADSHRTAVWDTFLSSPQPWERYRRRVLEQLFNGDLRRCDKIEHYEVGCCKDAKETKKLFLTLGIEALFPRLEFKILQRMNWTGSDRAIDDIALSSAVHSIFQNSYRRCAGLVLLRSAAEGGSGVARGPSETKLIRNRHLIAPARARLVDACVGSALASDLHSLISVCAKPTIREPRGPQATEAQVTSSVGWRPCIPLSPDGPHACVQS